MRRTFAPHRSDSFQVGAKRSLSCLLVTFLDLVNFVGDETMGLAVDRVGCVGIGGVDETEDLALFLVDPILEIFHPVLILDL